MRALLAIVAYGLLTACDSASSSPSPVPSTTPTTVPLSGGARTILRIDDPAAFSSTDAPCPVLDDHVVRTLLPDAGFPRVEVSRAESGATVFFVCRWGAELPALQIAAQWYPEIEPRLPDLELHVRDEIEREVAGAGSVGGFTAGGELIALLPDGVYLSITSGELSVDQIATIVPLVVARL